MGHKSGIVNPGSGYLSLDSFDTHRSILTPESLPLNPYPIVFHRFHSHNLELNIFVLP